jgi:hypothetical protein
LALQAQLDVPPLTLSLAPEYEGEGTRAGLRPDRGDTPRLRNLTGVLGWAETQLSF